MSFPLYDNGFWPALLFGLLFGLALEGAGLASARKLTAQFTLRDFAVLKVMFTAVVVAAIGLWLAEATDIIAPRSVYIPTLFLWATALGGALIGAGFVIGGYCPGTSLSAVASGRWDALVFGAGMVVGIGLFAAGFDVVEPLYRAARGVPRQTVDQLLGLPKPVI
ncbi:MAG: transporter, partial [Alphaproteobacteria bacterium]